MILFYLLYNRENEMETNLRKFALFFFIFFDISYFICKENDILAQTFSFCVLSTSLHIFFYVFRIFFTGFYALFAKYNFEKLMMYEYVFVLYSSTLATLIHNTNNTYILYASHRYTRNVNKIRKINLILMLFFVL